MKDRQDGALREMLKWSNCFCCCRPGGHHSRQDLEGDGRSTYSSHHQRGGAPPTLLVQELSWSKSTSFVRIVGNPPSAWKHRGISWEQMDGSIDSWLCEKAVP